MTVQEDDWEWDSMESWGRFYRYAEAGVPFERAYPDGAQIDPRYSREKFQARYERAMTKAKVDHANGIGYDYPTS